ncbi:hypothetical protein E2C01_083456 [Portunus trituberculatus]|uniref:Uncharacterized protein n=1 Tax=Portunus trituberculatus TaxID=210409 RepID=A0A5B7J6M3_PORTR|nr:hypothetical protein [Portunus trituberculatus]
MKGLFSFCFPSEPSLFVPAPRFSKPLQSACPAGEGLCLVTFNTVTGTAPFTAAHGHALRNIKRPLRFPHGDVALSTPQGHKPRDK